MINIQKIEYTEGDIAVFSVNITFFGISLYKRTEITTNKEVVNSLLPPKNLSKVGYKIN